MIFDDMKTDLASIMKKFVKHDCDIKYDYDGDNVIFYINEENGVNIQINIHCNSDTPMCQKV